MLRKIADPEPPTGLRRILFRTPIWLYRMRLGSLLGRRSLLLTHTGGKTGRRRRVVLEIVDHDPEHWIYHLASGYGQRASGTATSSNIRPSQSRWRAKHGGGRRTVAAD